jgi:hypothetical protein
LFTKPKQHIIEKIYGREKLVGDFNMERVSLLEILIWVTLSAQILPISLGVKFTQIMLPI